MSTFLNCSIISVEYRLHIKAITNALFDRSVCIELPITISTKSLNSIITNQRLQSNHIHTTPPPPYLQFEPIWTRTTSVNYQQRMQYSLMRPQSTTIRSAPISSFISVDPNMRKISFLFQNIRFSIDLEIIILQFLYSQI